MLALLVNTILRISNAVADLVKMNSNTSSKNINMNSSNPALIWSFLVFSFWYFYLWRAKKHIFSCYRSILAWCWYYVQCGTGVAIVYVGCCVYRGTRFPVGWLLVTGSQFQDCTGDPESGGSWSSGTWPRGGRRPAVERRGLRLHQVWTPETLRWSELRSAGRAAAPLAAWWWRSNSHRVRHWPKCCSWCPPNWEQTQRLAMHWRTYRPVAGWIHCGKAHWSGQGSGRTLQTGSNDRPRWTSSPDRLSYSCAHLSDSHLPLQVETEFYSNFIFQLCRVKNVVSLCHKPFLIMQYYLLILFTTPKTFLYSLYKICMKVVMNT